MVINNTYNLAVITGYVVGEVRIKDEEEEEKKVARIKLVTNHGFFLNDEWQKRFEYHYVYARKHLVEKAKRLTTGDLVHVVGSIRSKKYVDEEGKTQNFVFIAANAVVFNSRKAIKTGKAKINHIN